MTNEEAIGRIRDHMDHHGIGHYPHLKIKEALDLAISALQSVGKDITAPTKNDHFRDFTKMVPLTLEQLREMDGQPVWVHVIDHTVFADKEDDFDGWGMCRKSWVRIWDNKRADLVHVDYDFEDYEKEWIAYAYPPAHIDREAWERCWTCRWVVSQPNWRSDYKFCPRCGKPLTEEAWAEMEKRLRG